MLTHLALLLSELGLWLKSTHKHVQEKKHVHITCRQALRRNDVYTHLSKDKLVPLLINKFLGNNKNNFNVFRDRTLQGNSASKLLIREVEDFVWTRPCMVWMCPLALRWQCAWSSCEGGVNLPPSQWHLLLSLHLWCAVSYSYELLFLYTPWLLLLHAQPDAWILCGQQLKYVPGHIHSAHTNSLNSIFMFYLLNADCNKVLLSL